MTTKKPAAGGEIDSYCTKCKLDLNHRIIALVGEVVKKVECLTCGAHHMFRKTAAQKAAAKPTTRRTSTRQTAEQKAAALKKSERDRVSLWENAITGQPATSFRSYRISEIFSPGELVRHTKFGDGVIQRVIDRGKVEVLFQDGPRTMAHGQP